MSERLETAFEVCLQALATGASLEACLSLYPDLADELRPGLQAAAALSRRSPVQPAPAAQARSRNRVLAQAAAPGPRTAGRCCASRCPGSVSPWQP